jgi:glycosyltransferase involved in cell wall biosynthesis
MQRSSQHVNQSVGWPDGVGMVYFGMAPWDGMWKSRHQLMTRFSREMPVLYVEPCVWLGSLRTGQVKISRIVTDIGKTVQHCEPNVTVFRSPAYLPVSGSASLAGITQGMWLGAVRRAMRAAGISKPIVWISRPETRFVIGKLDEIFSIYHVVDEYTGYTGLTSEGKDRLVAMESGLLDAVDLVIVASPELQRAKEGPGREPLVLENGVEPLEYKHARESGHEPDDLAAIPKPRVGYSGLIGKRLNLELLRAAAQRRPDCSVVLVGKVDERDCEEALATLRSMSNVHLLGEKLGSEVASYVQSFDIGLLPYEINLATRHISPIKMYEYWAAGKPVLSTAIPAAQRHDFAVNVAKDQDEFMSMLDRLLDHPAETDPKEFTKLAAENSWQSRVDAVATELRSRVGAN